MRSLTLKEGAPARPFVLSDAEAEALQVAELASVKRVPGSQTWEVEAGAKVGAVAVGDLQVVVEPKIPIERLVFLIGYHRSPTYWRNADVLLDPEQDLASALGESFRRLTVKALEQGLLHGYRTVDETLPLLRGRIRVGDQLTRRLGIGLPLEVTYDDFTIDIAENRLLLRTAVQLMRSTVLPRTTRQGLQRIRLQLSDVTLENPGAPLPKWTSTRLNRRLQPSLRLAELILAGSSFEQRVGDLRMSGFVLDMWRVFEDFVCTALSEELQSMQGSASLQHRSHFDEDRSISLKPDFVWKHQGRPVVVADAKYKAEKPGGFPHADLYQLLAYCTVMELPEGHLVYARGNEAPASHVVRASGTRITCHAVELDASPDEVLADIARIAASMQN